ncbi:hypothetical protein L210DRAFT_804136, partial [Boletus edulis BED1]
TLICWIHSQNPKATFQVKISKIETVFELQEAIKNKKPITFRDVESDTLRLCDKPNYPVSRPYEDHLRKLNLSAHGTFLEGAQRLSKVFPEPPEDDIHVIVDLPSIYCWLRGGTLDSRFAVESSRLETIFDFKEAIKDKNPVALRNVDAATLRLFRI